MSATMTFPAREIRRIQLRTFRSPAAVLVATVIAAGWLKNRECFGISGAIIAGIGSYLWAVDTFRLRDPDAPLPSLAGPPQGPRGLVPLLGEGFRDLQLRAIDTIVSLTGVWITIGGGLFGTVVPFCLGVTHVSTGP
jgi:hypothetical protein